jgi:uncharacterized SAM-binding protein YcdF (DUF218 family)
MNEERYLLFFVLMRDAIIVLAGGINSDGSLPDLTRSRVDRGIQHFNNGAARILIMTGKYGFWLDWQKQVPLRSEAEAMKEYAISRGVSPASIVAEQDSKDTLGNAYFTKRNILEPNNWKNVLVITSDFHLERTKYIFDLVLGGECSIRYDAVETILPPEKLEALRKQETKTMVILKEMIGEINPGDMETIKNIIFSKHPGYSPNPEYSYERLSEMLGRR